MMSPLCALIGYQLTAVIHMKLHIDPECEYKAIIDLLHALIEKVSGRHCESPPQEADVTIVGRKCTLPVRCHVHYLV